ncbi:MAG TPA: ERCC4 domain-containing protein [Acidimicrobiales bacterium]|nr:ERCC4 domain-containing protein [Acidimicrobiales bacterium]
MIGRFLVARNPDPSSTLPYLVRIPLGSDGIVLKAKGPWPRTAKVFCHRHDEPWPDDAEIIDEAGVLMCERRGVAVDLVLDRGREHRSQFVFTRLAGGREAIFWQTPKTNRASRPNVRIPGRRASYLDDFVISVDTRERYAFAFREKQVTVDRRALPVGDYGVFWHGELIATVERKSLADLMKGVSDGSFVFQLAALASMPLAAVVVDARWSAVLKLEAGRGGWLAEQLARLHVRHPTVPVMFLETRAIAEDWTYRFLGAALAQRLDTPDDPAAPRPWHDRPLDS